MTALWRMVLWDLSVQRRSHFFAASAVTAVFLCIVLLLLPAAGRSPSVLALVIFLDPAVIGVSFVGGFMLLEKGAGTLSALAVTPMRGQTYVSAKIISFTLVGAAAGLAVALCAFALGANAIRPLALLGALLLSNAVGLVIGFVAAAPARSVNAYLANIMLVSLVMAAPVLGFFGGAPAWLDAMLRVIPAYGMLELLRFGAGGAAAPGLALDIAYLVLWLGAGWALSLRTFHRDLITGGL